PQPSISRILHEIASKGPVYSEIQRSSIPVLTPYLSEMLPEIKNANFYLADVSARIKLFSYREGSKWRSLSLWPIACCLWPCVSPCRLPPRRHFLIDRSGIAEFFRH